MATKTIASTPWRPRCTHPGDPVSVGDFTVYPTGINHWTRRSFEGADLIIPFEDTLPPIEDPEFSVLPCTWKDMGPPPDGFETFLEEEVIPALEAGKKIVPYCIGSHGRTGTFLASLIALLEGWDGHGPDPIERVRERHCRRAVETFEQADFVFELLNVPTPEKYVEDFFQPAHVPESGGSLSAYYAQLEMLNGGDSTATRVGADETVVSSPLAGLTIHGTLSQIVAPDSPDKG